MNEADAIANIMCIPTINSNTNFWMIRAKRGFFFDEYIQNHFIAIGWNSIRESTMKGGITSTQEKMLKAMIKQEYGEKVPGTAVNKCIKFYSHVKSGDIAMIVDRNRLAFATIGDYYEESNPNLTVELEKQIHKDIENAHIGEDSFECPYIKRRKITILKKLDEIPNINPYLFRAMAVNRHSLSDLNDYAEIILSGCFDSFIFKNKLTVTFRVCQQNDINAIDLADFVSNAARIVSNDTPDIVSVKTTLHSPGDILLQIGSFVQGNTFSLLLCYIAVFGGKAGQFELNSLIGVVKNVVNRNYEKQKQALELRKLEAEANLKEQEAVAKKLDNEEKQRNLQLLMADTYVKPLANAALKLDIRPQAATIIDISKIIHQNNDKQDQ